VDEVIGDLDVARRALEALGIGDVTDLELGAGALERRRPGAVANQATDVLAGLRQRRDQPPADESRCSGDQGPCRNTRTVKLGR
jgi:hypothetical protein